MDKTEFARAADKVNRCGIAENGIGTLGEKTLHAVLKYYFEPDEACHEVKVGRYIADIYKQGDIIEIQTRNFAAFRKKLGHFLVDNSVTIVYPVAHVKWIIWIDEQTGETTKKRKSPKVGKPYEIFFELYRIKNLLKNPNLSVCIVMLDMEEYRCLNGWSEDRKKGSTCFDRIPLDIEDEIYINEIGDYKKLIPENLSECFTSKDFKKESGLSMNVSQTALNILNYVGAVKRIGKQGNAYLYNVNI